MLRTPATLLMLLSLGLAGRAGAQTPDPKAAEHFEKVIRPILAEHCVGCHGGETAKSGLRLDNRAGFLKGGNGGPVALPGDPENSPLIEAVANPDDDARMPPKPKPRLSKESVKALTDWVKSGAHWPAEAVATRPDPLRTHWAFRKIAEPKRPEVKQPGWIRNDIDAFILARLESAGLAPSPDADRRTLIRRLSFDIIGLPPAPDEVDAFLLDNRPDAYERLVDRLLASPRYGERWARHWLDVARYADTKGYIFFEESNFPWPYTYRDYVVRSLNEDVPYDRFLTEQIAADKLDLKGDNRPLAALGFLTLGGRFMNNPHDVIDDRIDVVTRGTMGLTVTCARCHDHKFDPITQADYYALYGVFASSVEPAIPPLLGPPPKTPEYARFDAELKAREAKLAAFVREKHQAMVSSSLTRASEYMLAARTAGMQPNTEDFMLIADGNDLNPKMLLRWQVFLDRTRRSRDPAFSPWHALSALSEGEFSAKAGETLQKLAADAARPSNPIILHALMERPLGSISEAAAIVGQKLHAARAQWEVAAGRARLERKEPSPLPDAGWEQLRLVMLDPDAPPSVPMSPVGDLALLPDRPSQAQLQALLKAVETWRATGPGAPPRAMSLVDAQELVEPRIFLRGNPNNKGKAVPRRFLASLGGEARPFTGGSGRLELARAIASKDNPLTSRVMVNRVWMQYFGTPLASTPGDFGLRSDPPSNPALLDHLAHSFMSSNWSLKQLHRQVVTSSTYRQSSLDRDDARARDPENQLHWRQNRRRLDFEALRDAILFTSGTLDPTPGGPSTPLLTSKRRTLYGFIDRLNLPGLYRSFDFPSPDATSPKRDQTTVAPQALFLMNNPLLRENAKALAARVEKAASAPEDRLQRLYRLAYQRPPTARELAAAKQFLAQSAWPDLAQAMLLSNEFAFVD